MLKPKEKHSKTHKDDDSRSTQEVIIAQPLTAMPICVSNIPQKDLEKTQAFRKGYNF